MLAKFLQHQPFSRKFALIGLSTLALVLGLVALIASLIWADIDFARREKAGVSYTRNIVPLVSALQMQRQQALDAIGGSTTAKNAFIATGKTLEPLIAKQKALSERYDGMFATSATSAALLERTSRLLGNLPPSELQVHSEHDKVIADWIALTQDIANKSNLTLDPEFPTYYGQDMALVRLLPLSESVSLTRIKGLAGLAQKDLPMVARSELLGTRSAVMQGLRDLRAGAQDASQLPGLDAEQLKAQLQEIDAIADLFSESIQQIALESNFEHSSSAFAEESDRLLKVSGAMIGPLLDGVDHGLDARIQTAFWRIGLSVLASLLIASAVTYAFWIISHQVTHGARLIGDASSELAKGDCRVRIAFDSGDELGAIARRVNRTAESFSTLLLNVQAKSGQVASAANDIANAASVSSSAACAESEATSTIASAIEEMTNSLGETARLTEQAAGYSRESGRLANDGQVIAHNASQEILRVADRVRDSASRIEQLDARSSDIDAIVNTIRGLAEQTNLLALNAAIEAARAGDAGRGFAVVADEVRNLAERTREATRAISEIVESIQTEVRSAAGDILECTERVNATVALASEVSDALQRIRDSADVTLREVGGIEAATREQSSASEEIAKSISNIALMIEETSRNAEQSAKVAEHMRELSVELNSTVGQFKA